MSAGNIPGIIKKVVLNPSQKPSNLVLQVTNTKFIADAGRIRMIVQDGEYHINAMYTGNDPAPESIQKSAIVKLIDYSVDSVGTGDKFKRILFISKLEIVHPQYQKLGKGLSIDEYFRNHPEEAKSGSSNGSSDVSKSASSASNAASASFSSAARSSYKPQNLFAIDQLSPYQNLWTIKARVSYRSPIRTWKNARGEGKLFNVNFLDETNEIRATAFNQMADRLYDVLQEGKVFYVSKARINPAKSQFSNLKHPYELMMDNDTEVTECLDEADVPKLSFNFVPLSKIEDLEVNSIIDVCGVIQTVEPAFQITSKSTGKPYDRRDITIVDQSQFAIKLGLWNKTALDFAIPEGTVVAVKGCKIQDFGGRSLSLTQSGSLTANPDDPVAFKLKGWYDTQGKEQEFKTIKQEAGSRGNLTEGRKTISQAISEELGSHEKPDYFNLKGTISYVRSDNFSYPSCSNPGCNKKVIEQPDGSWRCEKCDASFPEANHRYILTCSVLDHTGQIWVTFFNESAEELMGVSANELMRLKEEGSEGHSKHFSAIQMKELNIRIQAREDFYNDTKRVRYNAQNIGLLDYNLECDLLVSSLEELLT